jgi:hypothetical protein
LAKYLGEGTSRKRAEEKSSAFLFLLKALKFPATPISQRLTKFGRTSSDRQELSSFISPGRYLDIAGAELT